MKRPRILTFENLAGQQNISSRDVVETLRQYADGGWKLPDCTREIFQRVRFNNTERIEIRKILRTALWKIEKVCKHPDEKEARSGYVDLFIFTT